MIRFQDYLSDKVEEAAIDCGIKVYQAAEFSDCGWWIFKDTNGVTKGKLYYFFDSDYCSVREDRCMFSAGVKCHYGNDVEEKVLLDYVKSLFPKVLSLEERLMDAKNRSFLNAASDNKSLDFEIE